MRASIQQKIWALLGLFLLGLVLLSTFHVSTVRQTLLNEKKLKTRHLVESAYTLIAHYYEQSVQGRMPTTAAQAAALAAVRSLRYADTEYFWVQRASEPVMIMHPLRPDLDGQRFDLDPFNTVTSVEPDDRQVEIVTDGRTNLGIATNILAAEAGSGYVTYQWNKPGAGGNSFEQYPKLSYIKKFAPWDWVVGSGIYIDDVDRVSAEAAGRNLLVIGVGGGILGLLALLLAGSVLQPLKASTRRMRSMAAGEAPLAPIAVGSNDEIGELLGGFNQLQEMVVAREERLRLAASVFAHSREGILIADRQGKVMDINAAFSQITGYAREEVMGRNPRILSSGRHDQYFYQRMWRDLTEFGYWQGEIWNRRKSGEVYPEQLTICAVRDTHGSIEHYVAVFSDITERKELEEQIHQLAFLDPLTNLPNRRLLKDRLRQAMGMGRRSGKHGALMVLDLDNFKPLNDQYGHDVGDLFLIEMAHRICQCVRETDTVSRFGGDEFVIVLAELDRDSGVSQTLAGGIAEKIRQAVAIPYVLTASGGERIEHHSAASIGVTLFFDHAATQEEVIKRADGAMYRAKQQGRNQVVFFGD